MAKVSRKQKVERIKKELPVHPWKGFRVSFGDSHLFCSGEQSFLTADYTTVKVNNLKPGLHYLLNKDLESVEIKKDDAVDKGQVLIEME